VVFIDIPRALMPYLILKGSIAVDGVSLTINALRENGFEVSLIPHTAGLTTIGSGKVGDQVNIETDLIGKYVERFVRSGKEDDRQPSPPGGIDEAFLKQSGFM
jgi:riboflavin synthase